MAPRGEASNAANLLQTLKNLSLLQIAALTTATLLIRWIAMGLYRIYFHPLSRFPGPRLSAFTRIPHVYASATGSLPKYVAQLHDKYGDVVRISPDELSFIDPQAWQDIYGYGTKGGRGSPPPKHFVRYPKAVNGLESLVDTQDPTEHARVRRIFSPAFSDRALKDQAPLFLRYAEQLVQVLRDGIRETKDGSATFDMVRMYNFTTFDVMGDLTFGEPLHMLDNTEYDPWVRIVSSSIKVGVRLRIIHSYYPLLSKIFKLLLEKRLLNIRIQHFNHSAARVARRLEKGRESAGVDIWDLVVSQQEQGKQGLSRGQMDVNASVFMLAGTETTATLLSGLTYLLLTHPASLKKLVNEIRGTFASSADINMEAIAKLPYLKACINEGLRRYPPVPMGMPHLTPADGSTICGEWVPPGTTVAAQHLVMYSSPRVFKDPLSFIPERWTGDPRFADDDRSALQPFSVGPRDCFGKNMAYHETRLILTKVLYNFDLELCPGNEGWLEQSTFLVWQKKPLMVNVEVASSSKYVA